MKMPSYRLGAEELVELGRAKNIQNAARQPFFTNRPRLGSGRYRLNDIQASPDGIKAAAEYISGCLIRSLATLSGLVGVPVSTLSQGAGITAAAASDLLENVPVMGDLLAQILVLGVVATGYAIAVPGLTPEGLANILGGVAKVLSAQATMVDIGQKTEVAQQEISQQAPVELNGAVRRVLNSAWANGEKVTK